MTTKPNTTTEAAELVSSTYAKLGRSTLSCSWCGGWEMYIDGDAVGSDTDTDKAFDLISHARFDHVGPCDIVATVAHTAMTVTR